MRMTEKGYKLYVNNLPAELREDGLKALFDAHGEVTAILSPTGADYAFVSYKTYAAAERAILHLNEQPPLHMNVVFAKKRETPPIRKLRNDIHDVNVAASPEIYQDPRYSNASAYISLGRGKTMPGYISQSVPVAQHFIADYNSDNEPLYPSSLDPSIYNPYDVVDSFDDTNIMWSRGHVLATVDGRRHVRMGRGYTAYELPKPRTRTREDIGKLYEKRIAEAYEYGINNLKDDIGKCEYCAKSSKTNCGRCGAFYCSRECQKADWLRHRNDCQAMPSLTRCVDSGSISRSSSDEIPFVSKEATSKNTLTLRRPRRITAANATASCENVTQNASQASVPTKVVQPEAPTAVDQNTRAPIESDVLSKNSKKVNPESIKTTNLTVASTSQEKVSVVDSRNGNNGTCEKTRSSWVKIPSNDNIKESNKLPAAQLHFNQPTAEPFGPSRSRQNGARNQSNFKSEAMHVVNNFADIDLSFKRRIQFLLKDVFTEIKITRSLSRDGGLYWARKLSDNDKLENIRSHLNSSAIDWPSAKPIVGNMYAALYESKWCRVIVKSLKPIKILCIDYGYEKEQENADLRAMSDFINVPGLVQKISIHPDSPARYKSLEPGTVISVKPLPGATNSEDQATDAIVVEVKPNDPIGVKQQQCILEKAPAQSENKPPAQNENRPPTQNEDKAPAENENIKPKFKNIVDEVRLKDTGMIEFVADMYDGTQSATILVENFCEVFENVMLQLTERCSTLREDPKYHPEVDDLVCARRPDGDWFRGRVLTPGTPVRVLSVDEAKVVSALKVYRLPEEFIDLVTFGIQCNFVERKIPFEVGERCAIDIIGINKKADKREVEISISIDNGEQVKALATEWIPAPEQMGILNAPLKTGSEVYLSAIISHYNLHACSLAPEEMERMKRVKLDVSKDAQTAQSLREMPVLGQMVSCKFSGDGNYYRAVVQKLQGDKIGVNYVDFGNREYTALGNLKVLRDDLKIQPAGCTKLALKDVPRDVAMTKEVHEFLSNLMISEIGLICKFDGVPFTDGVVLILPNGTIVNDKVKEMLTPSHMKPAKKEEKTIFMECDMDVANLGEIGETITAEVVSVKKNGFCYLVCATDEQAVAHIIKVLSPLLNTHCQAVQEPYIPRKNELCLAMYENNWYRALCVDPSANSRTILVFYVDFGNSEHVEHKNIRPMVKDFMSPPSLINICTVNNLCPPGKDELPPNVAAKVQSLMQSNTHATIKIIKKLAPGEYEIELPAVRAVLVADGLLNS